VNFGPGGPDIPCGDMHQSFTDPLVYLFVGHAVNEINEV